MILQYNLDNLDLLLIEMGEYLQENQGQNYESDFKGKLFDLLTNTALFHDAIGKEIERKDDNVTITTDY
jgi:hypothetical protein